MLELAVNDRTVRSTTAAQGVWGLSDVTVPPKPSCVPSVLLRYRLCLVLWPWDPAAAYNRILRDYTDKTPDYSNDDNRSNPDACPQRSCHSWGPPIPLSCCQEGPRIEGTPDHHVPMFGSPSPGDVWGSQGSTDVPVRCCFCWVGASMPGSLCR